MELAPIIVFAYNRPDHYRQTLDALSKNYLADQSILYLYCDGAKEDASDDTLMRVADVRAVAYAQHWAKETYVVESNVNKGLADSIIGGVSEIVKKYGCVIVLEDDMITSPGFLQYMNDALKMYKDDARVMHITGYMYPHKWPLPETFFYEVPHCWSWATWDRAWKYFSNDIDELYIYWSKDWSTFNKYGGTDLQNQLTSNYNRTLRTWFVKWHAVVLRNNGLTLYPNCSLISNIGLDGSGDNCGVTNHFDIADRADKVCVHRIPIEENRFAAYCIKIAESGHWYSKRYRKQWFNKIRKILHI